MNPKTADLKNILHKAEYFCTYQERSPDEVVQKLREWDIAEERIPVILEQLQHSNFVNEQRFAELFTQSKFRLKNWGKIKIRYELRQRKISESIIHQSLLQIDEESYLRVLQSLFLQKSKETKESDLVRKNQKIIRFLISKGFESNLIFELFQKT